MSKNDEVSGDMEKEMDKILNTWKSNNSNKNNNKKMLTWKPPSQAVYKVFERGIY